MRPGSVRSLRYWSLVCSHIEDDVPGPRAMGFKRNELIPIECVGIAEKKIIETKEAKGGIISRIQSQNLALRGRVAFGEAILRRLPYITDILGVPDSGRRR